MQLLDLPPEVFQRIVGVLVKKHGLAAAWKVRGTSKAFETYITYEVLATPSLYAYNKTRAGRQILKHKLADFLYTRSIKLNGFVRAHVPEFIRACMWILEPWITNDEAASTLRKTLCELFVRNHPDALKCVLTTEKKLNKNEHEPIAAPHILNVMAGVVATGDLFLLIAAAEENRISLWEISPVFGYPLDVAVYAGHFTIVKAIAQQAVINQTAHVADIHRKHAIAEHKSFDDAIRTGIELHRTEIVAYLLEKYVLAFGPTKELCMVDWLDEAVTRGHKDMLELLIKTPTQAGSSTFYKAFKQACRILKPSLLCVFFPPLIRSPNHLSINQVYGANQYEYPLMTASRAATSRNVPALVKELLHLGADPNGPKYLAGLKRPLRLVGYFHCDENILLLLEAGANPHLINDARWMKELLQTCGRQTEIGKAMRAALKRFEKPEPMKGVEGLYAEIEEWALENNIVVKDE